MNLGPSPIGQKLKCGQQLVTTTKQSPLQLHSRITLIKHKLPKFQILGKHKISRELIVEAHSQDGLSNGTNLFFPSLERLLNALTHVRQEEKIPEELQKLGREVKQCMKSLENEVEIKTNELTEVKIELELVSRELGETCQLLAACQEELEMTTATVETLREEVQVARGGREDDNKSTLAKYRELEEALALAQVELEDQSINNETIGSGNGMGQLRDIVNDQEQVLGDLLVSLEEAESARSTAEQRVNKAEEEASVKANMVVELEERRNTLEGLLEDTKDALKKAEELWKLERDQYRSVEVKLKDKLIIAARKLDEKAKVAKDTQTSLEVLQFQYHQKVHLAEMLELKCESLKAECKILSQENGVDLSQDLESQLHIRKLEEEIAVLNSKLSEVDKRDQVWAKKTNIQLKDIEAKDRQVQDLEQVLHEIQTQLCQKSDALSSSQEISRLSTLDAQHKKRQIKDLKKQIARLKHDLEVKGKKMGLLSARVEAQHKLESNSRIAVAKLQRDLGKKIVNDERQVGDPNELENRVSELHSQLLKQEKAFAEQQDNKERVIAELRSQLLAAQKKQNSPNVVQQPGKNDFRGLDDHEHSNGDPNLLSIENSQLMYKVSALEAELKKSQAIHESLKNQLENVIKSEETAHGELEKMVAARSNGAIVDAYATSPPGETDRGATSIDTAESDVVISDLKNQLDSLQAQVDGKEVSINKLESALAGEKAHAIKMSKALNQDIQDLSKTLGEQRDSFVALAEGKAAAEMKVKEIEELLQSKMIELEDAWQAIKQESTVQKRVVDSSEPTLADIRRIAAEELEATAKLLERAEQVALATRESMETTQGNSFSSTTPREKQYQNELEVQVANLKTLLEKKSLAASEAIQRSEGLEYEVSKLTSKLAQLQKANQARKNILDDKDAPSNHLSEVSESNETAQKESQQPQKQLLSHEATRIDSDALGRSVDIKSDEVHILKAQVEVLEEENVRLKKVAARRNKVLAQSKRFIQQYLDRATAPDKEQP